MQSVHILKHYFTKWGRIGLVVRAPPCLVHLDTSLRCRGSTLEGMACCSCPSIPPTAVIHPCCGCHLSSPMLQTPAAFTCTVQEALEKLVMEVTLLGFISLLLLMLEGSIDKICGEQACILPYLNLSAFNPSRLLCPAVVGCHLPPPYMANEGMQKCLCLWLSAVSYNSAAADWTLISHINGCPCCLSHTAGISTCAQVGR